MPALPDNGCPQRLALTELPAGVSGRVAEVNGKSEFSQRLREMGFCESAIIQKIAGKHLLICQLCGTRVALSDQAAQNIVVEPIRGDA
ncbi:MAG: FeoA family protein [Opitutaceae bacterium]|nr:FeoA family protein [Opitutaceae bacterium]